MVLKHLGKCVGKIVIVGGIGLVEFAIQFLGGLLTTGFVQIDNGHLPPIFGECFGRGQA